MTAEAPSAASRPSRMLSLADRLKQASTRPSVVTVPTTSVERNPEQPRKHFDDDSLAELAESIRAHGLIQHLIVRTRGPGRYQLVAGERRWRAAQIAGLKEVPVVVRELSDAAALAIALIENIDREGMLPTDEVTAVAKLAAETSVQDAAKALGKTPAWVSKRKRIAEAPPFVVEFVASGRSNDIEALYELAKLADEDEAGARSLIENYVRGAHLREQVKSTARANKEPQPSDGAGPVGASDFSGAEPGDLDADDGHDGALSHAKASPGGADGGRARGTDSDRDESRASPAKKPADRTLTITGAVQRRGAIVLLTLSGDEVPCVFKRPAREQLLKLLEKS